nr:MAG TPA: hypothetical protein [Caudoviricetes sp.]DAY24016.1 MAG TPA: hypothetical protein [Caudoviricetes sp.]
MQQDYDTTLFALNHTSLGILSQANYLLMEIPDKHPSPVELICLPDVL